MPRSPSRWFRGLFAAARLLRAPQRAASVRTRRLEVEPLEGRNLPSAFTVTLPQGGGTYLLTEDTQSRVVLREGNTDVFAQPRSQVSELRIQGVAAADALTVDFATPAMEGLPLTLVIEGGGGADRLELLCPAGRFSASLSPGSGHVLGEWLDVTANGFPTLKVTGGGPGNFALLYGTAGSDRLAITPGTLATLAANDYSIEARGFWGVAAYGLGGSDQALLIDTPVTDEVVLKDGYSVVKQSETLFARAFDFEDVTAQSISGGADQVWLYDTPGRDLAQIKVGHAQLGSVDGTKVLQALGFKMVRVFSVSGGLDEIWLHDTPGNDNFVLRPMGVSTLKNGSRLLDVVFLGFKTGSIYGSTGTDVATLYDSPYTDLFYGADSGARSPIATLTNTGRAFLFYVVRYDRVKLIGGAGQRNFTSVLPGSYSPYILETSNFAPMTTFYSGLTPGTIADSRYSLVTAPYYLGVMTRSQSLARLKRLVLGREPRLAHAQGPLEIARILSDHVHHSINSGVNSPGWSLLDPYHRYLVTSVYHFERAQCGVIANVYEDVLEAFGLAFRRVSMFRADGSDSHTGTDVRIDGRWIAFDATFNINFATDAGTLLSYAELASQEAFRIVRTYTAQRRLMWEAASRPYQDYLAVVRFGVR